MTQILLNLARQLPGKATAVHTVVAGVIAFTLCASPMAAVEQSHQEAGNGTDTETGLASEANPSQQINDLRPSLSQCAKTARLAA